MRVRYDDRLCAILLQFSFSNSNLIPASLAEMQAESLDGHAARKAVVKGKEMVKPSENCDVRALVADLAAAGFYLDNAGWQSRVNLIKPGRYYMVRFTFRRGAGVQNPEAVQALTEFCGNAFWRVRGYVNPVFEGVNLVDECAASLNFEARVPIRDGQGSPILQWRKDGEGKRIGSSTVELQPEYTLRIQPQVVELVRS